MEAPAGGELVKDVHQWVSGLFSPQWLKELVVSWLFVFVFDVLMGFLC